MKPNRFRSRNARHLALQVLLECQKHDAFVQAILDKHLSGSSLSAADKRLATQLVYSVLRRRGTLDALLRDAVTRRKDQVEPALWEALRLGVYQLAFLSHVPPHAAINETVNLAADMGKPRGKGFLNGVLRKVASLITNEFTVEPAADALPFEDGTYRKLTASVLPNPGSAAVEYFASAFSFPRWLTNRWFERFGWEECVRLGFWFAGPAPLSLRCNTLRTDRESLLSAFHKSSISAIPGDHPQSVRLLEHAPIHSLPGFADGWFSVQDESAMWAASALAPKPGSRILDLCAAPGGKTAHLAELMNNEGSIVACDADAKRLTIVENLCRRLGITIVEPHAIGKNQEPPPGPFEAVLVDVPCSNTGVLGKRPEARWRLKPDGFEHLVRLQTKLLLHAAERVAPGGVVVYSTCSIEPEENENVVQTVLQFMPTLSLQEEKRRLPGQPADGAYLAVISNSPHS